MSHEAQVLFVLGAMPHGALVAHLETAVAADLIGEGVADESEAISAWGRGWNDGNAGRDIGLSALLYRRGLADARALRSRQ